MRQVGYVVAIHTLSGIIQDFLACFNLLLKWCFYGSQKVTTVYRLLFQPLHLCIHVPITFYVFSRTPASNFQNQTQLSNPEIKFSSLEVTSAALSSILAWYQKVLLVLAHLGKTWKESAICKSDYLVAWTLVKKTIELTCPRRFLLWMVDFSLLTVTQWLRFSVRNFALFLTIHQNQACNKQYSIQKLF